MLVGALPVRLQVALFTRCYCRSTRGADVLAMDLVSAPSLALLTSDRAFIKLRVVADPASKLIYSTSAFELFDKRD